MKIDITRLVGAVTREISTREFKGKPARGMVASRAYDTTVEDLWDALTSADRLPRWFLPVSGDLRLGGRYQLEGHASGEITKCEPPRYLSVSWESGKDLSWVEVELQAGAEGGTVLRLEHIAHIPDDDKFWDQYGPGATGVGWEHAFWGLELHLEKGGVIVTPKEAEAWLSTDEGKVFISQSSAEWGEASIAVGTDEHAARAAAQRTTEFYSG